MSADYIAVFLIGFFGGFSHCIGMCGGFVLTYTFNLSQNTLSVHHNYWQKLYPHLLYNSGRILTYTLLGEIFGFLGFVFSFRSFQGGIMVFAGILMVFLGFHFAGIIPSLAPDTFPGTNTFKYLVKNLLQRVNPRNIFGLGFVLGFLPCGMVYAVATKAAATQSLLGGGLTMLVFGIGTLPAMVLTGVTAHLISDRWRKNLYRVAALMVVILGIVTIIKGFKSFGIIIF